MILLWGFGTDGMSANIFPASLRAGEYFSYFPIYCKIATQRKTTNMDDSPKVLEPASRVGS